MTIDTKTGLELLEGYTEREDWQTKASLSEWLLNNAEALIACAEREARRDELGNLRDVCEGCGAVAGDDQDGCWMPTHDGVDLCPKCWDEARDAEPVPFE